MATVLLLGSPGPAPLTLAAVGSSFGLSRGLRFLWGILIALFAVAALSAVGVEALLQGSPVLKSTLLLFSAGYLCFVAYKIAFAGGQASDPLKVPTILDGFLLNIFNPKAYAAFVALLSTYRISLQNSAHSILLTAGIAFLIACLVDFLWLYLGAVFFKKVRDPNTQRITRYIFASLIVLTLLLSFVFK